MRFECLQNNLIHKKYMQDQNERLIKRLQQIKTRRPIFVRVQNLPVLPIVQSGKVARINNNKRIQLENKKIKMRLEMLSNTKSNYGGNQRGSKIKSGSFSPKLKSNNNENSLSKL